jgi:hypothetical protein
VNDDEGGIRPSHFNGTNHFAFSGWPNVFFDEKAGFAEVALHG